MRELTAFEVNAISGGGAPLGSDSAGEYFESCLGYMSPSNTVGFAMGAAGFLPGGFGAAFGAASGGWMLVTGAVCGIGTLQYFQ